MLSFRQFFWDYALSFTSANVKFNTPFQSQQNGPVKTHSLRTYNLVAEGLRGVNPKVA